MSEPITAPPIARSGHATMEAVRPTEPNAGLVGYEPGAHHPWHKHAFAQVWYILEGEFRIGARKRRPSEDRVDV
jgi:quercetin dioxygenase-like cupin family protein